MTGDVSDVSVNYSDVFSDRVDRNYFQLNYSSYPNDTEMMDDKSINKLCDSPELAHNTSLCDRKGLGITLSTPIIMMSTGVVGNIIAIIVLYTARKEMKRTVFYIFLFGMAWSDLFSQLLLGPIAIIVYANNLEWVGGEPVCKYHAFAMICFGVITPLFVCCMSLERVLALRFPYFHGRAVNVRRARILILLCWIFVLLFCCLPFLGFGSYEHQYPGSWCFLNFHKESDTDVAYAYMFAIINLVLIIVIIVANSTVMFTLLQMRKTRKINNSPSFIRRYGVNGKSKLKMEEETHMVWFLCAITLAFATCYLPLNINIIINQISGRKNFVADLLSLRMASINQILDPWLYVLLRKSVIIKGIKCLRYACTKNGSLKCQRQYVTNYSQSEVNSSMRNKDIHELSICNPKISLDINGDLRNRVVVDISDGSSSSGMETEDEGEKRQLTPPHRASRLSDSNLHVKRTESLHSGQHRENGLHDKKQTKQVKRKISSPARLFHST